MRCRHWDYDGSVKRNRSRKNIGGCGQSLIIQHHAVTYHIAGVRVVTSLDNGLTDARGALEELMCMIAEVSANAAYNLGIDFDLDDPRVVRWLIITTFDGMFLQGNRSKSADLLAIAAAAAPDKNSSHNSSALRRRGKPTRTLVTWDVIVASDSTCLELHP